MIPEETKFKVLMYCGQVVDEGRLNAGIYSKSVPTLHDKNTTMESLIERAKKIRQLNSSVVGKNHIENLMKCELKEIEFKKFN